MPTLTAFLKAIRLECKVAIIQPAREVREQTGEHTCESERKCGAAACGAYFDGVPGNYAHPRP